MRLLVVAGLVALALVPAAASRPAAVPPPSQAGPWHQLGSAVTSRPGALVSVSRPLLRPHALAVVATSSSARRIRVTWFSYCEFDSDDGPTEEHTGTLTGVKRITKYLSVMTDSTLCQVSVTARIPGKPKVRVTAAVFGY